MRARLSKNSKKFQGLMLFNIANLSILYLSILKSQSWALTGDLETGQ